jgi:hypothetical protein
MFRKGCHAITIGKSDDFERRFLESLTSKMAELRSFVLGSSSNTSNLRVPSHVPEPQPSLCCVGYPLHVNMELTRSWIKSIIFGFNGTQWRNVISVIDIISMLGAEC